MLVKTKYLVSTLRSDDKIRLTEEKLRQLRKPNDRRDRLNLLIDLIEATESENMRYKFDFARLKQQDLHYTPSSDKLSKRAVPAVQG